MDHAANNELSATIRTSTRVRALMTDAVRATVYVKLGSRLDDVEAALLAEIGNLEEVLRLLRSRLSIPRTYPGLETTRDVQVLIAAAEVAADAKGVHTTAEERL